MVRYFSYFLGFIAFTLNVNAMNFSLDEKQPITPQLIKKGKENYLEMQKGQEDLLVLAKQGKFEEAYKSTQKTALCKLEWTLSAETIEALFINVFSGSMGHMNLFAWDASKGDENYYILDREIYQDGSSSVIRDPRHCTGLIYNFKSLLNTSNIFWTYQKGKGYEQKSITESIWHCTAEHIYTDKHHQHKGMATNAIKELVNFVFKSTSANFIVASVANERIASRKAFLKNKFVETNEIKNADEPGYEGAFDYSKEMKFITLDGGQTFILPLFYPGLGGNLYLSRYDWEKNQPQ